MRFSKNSWEAFRGEFGINQLASRMFTSLEDRRSCSAFGVTSKGALEYIDLDMDCILCARGTPPKAAGRNAERIILRCRQKGSSYALPAQIPERDIGPGMLPKSISLATTSQDLI